jgi:hypothetical protein
MADEASLHINAIIAFYESKRREFRAEIDQIDKSLEQLRRWNAGSKLPEVQPPDSRKASHEGETIRDMVLRLVSHEPTFRLTAIVDQLIQSGSMSGTRTAIYGTVTSMLRRNGHIFVKVRRGLYRVKQAAANEPQIMADARGPGTGQTATPVSQFDRPFTTLMRGDVPGLEPRIPPVGAPIPPEIARLSKVGSG